MARILVCDDFETMRKLLCKGFSAQGHQVFPASDGIEAYNLFLEIKPDIILSDIHMPRMNGLDLVLALRKQGYQIPVILISGGSTYIHGYLQDVVVLKKPGSQKKLSLLVEALTLQ